MSVLLSCLSYWGVSQPRRFMPVSLMWLAYQSVCLCLTGACVSSVALKYMSVSLMCDCFVKVCVCLAGVCLSCWGVYLSCWDKQPSYCCVLCGSIAASSLFTISLWSALSSACLSCFCCSFCFNFRLTLAFLSFFLIDNSAESKWKKEKGGINSTSHKRPVKE